MKIRIAMKRHIGRLAFESGTEISVDAFGLVFISDVLSLLSGVCSQLKKYEN